MLSTATICAVIALFTIVLLFTKLPRGMVATFGVLLMVLFGVTDFSSAFKQYSSSTVIIIISMMIVGAALFETGMAAYLGNLLTRLTGTNEVKLAAMTFCLAFVFSGFLAPNGAFFMFMPLIIAICQSSKISVQRLLYVFMIGLMNGSYITLVGANVNLNSQNVLLEMGFEGWGFFEMAPLAFLGLATLLPTVVFMVKKNIIPNRMVTVDIADVGEFVVPKKITPKMMISGGTLIVAIILMACGFEWLSTELIAAFAACIVVFTGCIGAKKAFMKVEWSAVMMVAGLTAIAKCIQSSGLMEIMAEYIGSMLGSNTFIAAMVFYFVSCVGTQFMSNSAWVALCTPIALACTAPMGIAPKAVAGMIMAGSTSCMLTPMSTSIAGPCMEITKMTIPELFRCGVYVLLASIVASVCWLVFFLM